MFAYCILQAGVHADVTISFLLQQAIESGHMEELREAVAAMKENSAKSCLDVCEMVRAESGKYPMTLLAYAGYHDRKDMFSYLLSQGGARTFSPIESWIIYFA